MSASFLPGDATLLAASQCFPDQYLDNQQLLDALTTLSGKRYARIAARIAPFLGIEGRYFSRSVRTCTSAPSPSNSELVTSVIEDLLNQSHTTLADIDYLVGHTTTPDTQLPPSIAWVAEKLRYQGPFMELRQACTGFSSALQIIIPRLAMVHKPVIIAGSETGSVYFDYHKGFLDQSQLVNYMQMGDGAGGVILAPSGISGMGKISHCFTGQIGVDQAPGLSLDGGSLSVYTQGGKARFHHNATNVRKSGEALFQAGILALRSQGFELEQFDYIIPHQASGRIDELLSQALNIDQCKIINDAKVWGNLGSAAIWCSFSKLIGSGKLHTGAKVAVLGAEATKYMYGGFVYTHG